MKPCTREDCSPTSITTTLAALCAAVISAACAEPALAYIGPGAGFAFLGSTAVLFLTIGMGLLTLCLWPVGWAWRKLRGKGISKRAKARRVVIVGLDGLEPKLVEAMMKLGKLPNLSAVQQEGSYSRLGTTLPALSPVAWSTFQTGVNPGAHNIFDFLTRDKRLCLPQLASTETATIKRRLLGIPRKQTKVVLTRKSQPFWKVLGSYGIHSNILRVPISYPPEPFQGNVLSAMCTPDLKGTQGSFSFFSTRKIETQAYTGGAYESFRREGELLHFEVEGPPNPKQGSAGEPKFLTASCTLKVGSGAAELTVGSTVHQLVQGEFSEWITLEFQLGRKKVSGVARFLLRETAPEVSLYISPVNANPERPALPIAAPLLFSQWLARKVGVFGTLGLMEDTWGRNELALDDRGFLAQSYLNHDERERMFFEVLAKTREGVCACVFDASDRIQHMFWRYIDDKHPSPREGDEFKNAIPEMYERMDRLVGKVRSKLKSTDVLIILSDHGFSSFRRGINLNTWLWQHGYLALKNDSPSGKDYFQDVDWSRTRAFACGLSGIYINRVGREANGIVAADDVETLKAEISSKLGSIVDPQDGERAIRAMHDTARCYRGLYVDEAPDLIVGYAPGYRVSWESVTGLIESEVFSNNVKAWSGDHHIDPKEIPGIFFSNRPLKKEAPHIVDMAPTVLDIFGVRAPRYMEGSAVL